MSYIVKDLEKYCKPCDFNAVIRLLKQRGDLDERHEYYRSIYFFYTEARTLFPKDKHNRKKAREHTMQMLGITRKTFYNSVNRMRRRL